jgi:serine phosphatase RsbU (regulator of sigma subunit)
MCSLFRSQDAAPLPVSEPVPNPFPKMNGAEIAAEFLGQQIAGDFYDAIRVSPERVLFGLLDVAGRREDNRAILAAAQEIFRKVGSELFAPADINEADAMTELCLHLNRHLIETSKGVHSCPAFIGCYHEMFGTLCYTNAGHTAGLLSDSTGIIELGSTGLPLGLFSHATSESPIAGVEKGAALVLVSRGVIECGSNHDKSDDEFGLERVKGLLKGTPRNSAPALCRFVLSAAGTFGAGRPKCDDQTALALVRTI